MRLHAGIWVMLIATTVVALEGSQLLIYVTRFTEDIFASLISIIFIAESFYFIYQVVLFFGENLLLILFAIIKNCYYMINIGLKKIYKGTCH